MASNGRQTILRLAKVKQVLCSFCRKWHSPGQEVEINLTGGRNLRINSGKIARLADASCVVSSGDTNVMATVVGKQSSSSPGFLPLTVDFRQKSAAAGRIPKNFLRRDIGISERETLISRTIDRSLRPLFPAGFFWETQVVCNLLSVDGIHDPEILSINAASAALALSDIPWNGPIGAVRVGLINNEVVINPTRKELMSSTVNLIVTGTENKYILMIDGSASEPVAINHLLKILKEAAKEARNVINGIKSLQKMVGKPKREIERYLMPTAEQIDAVKTIAEIRLIEVLTNYKHDKFSRDNEFMVIRQDVLEKMKEHFVDEDPLVLQEAYNQTLKSIYRDLVFESNKRTDGRTPSQLRNIDCEVRLYKSLHGSSLFQRGQTQVLCSLTLDSLDSAFKADDITTLIGGMKEKNFMLHYEFPSFATNEIGRSGAFGRREIGHGALAEKALRSIIPTDFPFAIRLNCEVLESNGSSSMASVCAGSLALLDAGVEISSPASGVAIGLLSRPLKNESNSNNDKSGEKEYKVLTDILGLEDYLGDMDFKIAATKKGFTALQLDTKLGEGLPLRVVMDALNSSIAANKEILSIMNSTIKKPNEKNKELWPVTHKIEVLPHKRSKLFGFGGHNLKRLTEAIGVRISADDESPNTIVVYAPNKDAMKEATESISTLLSDDEYEPQLDFGGIYSAKIVEMRDNGVMVELYPKMRPVLLTLKELDQRKVGHPSALGLEIGQEIQVKYFGRDPVSGYMRISRRVLQITTAKAQSLIRDS